MSGTRNNPAGRHRVVIVGGGAGGLELATRLGDTLGKRGRAEITLIDRNRTHVWKPKLHEIAAGSMDMSAHEVGYLAQAHWHHFRWRVGAMVGLDRARREVLVAPYVDDEGQQVTAQRVFGYDTLVVSIGSLSNDFGTPGVAEHAMKLETAADAQRFRTRVINACIRAHAQATPLRPEQLKVAIIGAAGPMGLMHTMRSVVLGVEGSKAAQAYAVQAVNTAGISKQAALESSALFAQFGKAGGLKGTGLTEFSTEMTQLAGDLASFSNTSVDQAITAIGAGIPKHIVIARNVLRNALITPITVLGLRVGYLMGGAVIIEIIFNIQAMGQLILDGVTRNDVFLVQGVTLTVAIAFIVINILVDVLYVLVNPRIRTV